MKIRNWTKFQHFKDRRPPWIKLHRDILDQRDIMMISSCHFRLLTLLWLLASEDDEKDGVLPSITDISFRLRMPEKEIAQLLPGLSKWIDDVDIMMISKLYQLGPPETETETETYKPEIEKESLSIGIDTQKRRVSDSIPPYHELLDAYNKFCPSLSRATELTDSRKRDIKLRWLKYLKHESGPLTVFDTLFKKAESSDFITGRDGRWQGKRGIDWLLNEKNMVKTLEGNYDNGKGGRDGLRDIGGAKEVGGKTAGIKCNDHTTDFLS